MQPCQALAEAIKRANKLDLMSIRSIKAMRSGPISTVVGSIEFDDKGDVKNPDYIIFRWSKGDYLALKDE